MFEIHQKFKGHFLSDLHVFFKKRDLRQSKDYLERTKSIINFAKNLNKSFTP